MIGAAAFMVLALAAAPAAERLPPAPRPEAMPRTT